MEFVFVVRSLGLFFLFWSLFSGDIVIIILRSNQTQPIWLGQALHTMRCSNLLHFTIIEGKLTSGGQLFKVFTLRPRNTKVHKDRKKEEVNQLTLSNPHVLSFINENS